MEILLPQFDIEKAIASNWEANKTKLQIIETDRETAFETATNALRQQFQRELDTYLDGNIQKSLTLRIFGLDKLDVFAPYAVFVYDNNEFVVNRDAQNNWKITSNLGTITTTGDLLQKTFLLELGRLKKALEAAGYENNSK
jgi:hypothetical protein